MSKSKKGFRNALKSLNSTYAVVNIVTRVSIKMIVEGSVASRVKNIAILFACSFISEYFLKSFTEETK
jgi:hypothetical protein